jgi:hypothetical protein
MLDDIAFEDPISGEPTWKVYENGQTYPWENICTYDDFPYRCPNGQCVPNEFYCAESEILFPVCNGRGKFYLNIYYISYP